MGNLAEIMGSVRRKIAQDDENVNRIPFGNDKISKIMDFYQFTNDEVYEIFSVFRKMDKLGTGYINLDSIYTIIGEEVGIISPYLERLFSLIKKQHVEKVNFLEFLPVLSTFCLYTRQQLISFVFSMLDTDHNGFISKKDMLNFIADERFGLPIFTQNFLLSIDSMELERPDRISFEQFLSIEQDILFLIYPITRLQKRLQKVFGGEKLWENVYTRILKLEKEDDKKNAQFQKDGMKGKKAASSEQKMKEFEELISKRAFQIKYRSLVNHLPPREPQRRGSESRVGTKLRPLIDQSPKKHRSVIYRRRPFIAADENEEINQGKTSARGSKREKTKKQTVKMQRLPSFQLKEKLGKSITSIIHVSSRKRQIGASRKSSIESIHSLAAEKNKDKRNSGNLTEKTPIVSPQESRTNFKYPSNQLLLKSKSSVSFIH